MNIDQLAQKVSLYMSSNLGMLPRTADMASKRYVRQYMEEMEKQEISTDDLPDLGAWLAAKFLTMEIIDKDRVEKLISDFRSQSI